MSVLLRKEIVEGLMGRMLYFRILPKSMQKATFWPSKKKSEGYDLAGRHKLVQDLIGRMLDK